MQSVHLRLLPALPAIWQNDKLAADWAQIWQLRRVVTSAIELKRADKTIGSSLQAHPHLYITVPLAQQLDWAELCITSSAALHESAPPPNAFMLPDVLGIGVVVQMANGEKCERCWKVLPEVSNCLCQRCANVVGDQQVPA